MRYDLKSGFETFVGAAVAGATRNVVTQHPANPVPRTNWYVDGGLLAAGLLTEFLGAQTGSRMFHELGEGLLAPAFAYTTSDLVQLGRNQLVKNAASAPAGAGSTAATGAVNFAATGAALSDAGY